MAGLAHVSIGTASKALNGRGRLRAETRDRVRDAAAALGFRPNPFGPAAAAGRGYTVGLITDGGDGRLAVPVLRGAEDALGAGRAAVFFCDSRGDPVRLGHYLAMLAGRRVDGLIVTGPDTAVRPPLELPAPMPVVYAVTRSADPADACAGYDDEAGARLAVEHLIAVGRRHIAYVSGPGDDHAAVIRFRSWAAALAAAGLPPVRPDLAFGAWSEEWGWQAAALLAAGAPGTDAVFCGSDQIARGVIDGLRACGRRVPGDVAVAGFGDWPVMTTGRRPTLTSVDPGPTRVGRLAGECLLAALRGEHSRGLRLVAPRLVVRESTAAA